YGAAVTRINRKHHGPLKRDQSKPPPKPGCYMLFNSIASNEDEICKGLKAGKDLSTDATGLIVGDSSGTRGNTRGVDTSSAPGTQDASGTPSDSDTQIAPGTQTAPGLT